MTQITIEITDVILEAVEYVLSPPMVPCDHPGYTRQFESQTTLVDNAKTIANLIRQAVGEDK